MVDGLSAFFVSRGLSLARDIYLSGSCNVKGDFKMLKTPDRDLQARLKLVGLTMRKVSEGLPGISYSQLSNYVNGWRDMPADVRRKIDQIISNQYGKGK